MGFPTLLSGSCSLKKVPYFCSANPLQGATEKKRFWEEMDVALTGNSIVRKNVRQIVMLDYNWIPYHINFEDHLAGVRL